MSCKKLSIFSARLATKRYVRGVPEGGCAPLCKCWGLKGAQCPSSPEIFWIIQSVKCSNMQPKATIFKLWNVLVQPIQCQFLKNIFNHFWPVKNTKNAHFCPFWAPLLSPWQHLFWLSWFFSGDICPYSTFTKFELCGTNIKRIRAFWFCLLIHLAIKRPFFVKTQYGMS